jgi:hypothetical protein
MRPVRRADAQYETTRVGWSAKSAFQIVFQRESLQSRVVSEIYLTTSQTRARDSLASGVWERLQTIPQLCDSAGVFYGHIGQS